MADNPDDHQTTRTPIISVVMGVRNGANSIVQTMDSVLAQQDVNFEVVVVDDGSTDSTSELLADYRRRDPRVRVLTREARGLTKSLIEGCHEARGEFIARQDCGDQSLPGRLRRQQEELLRVPEASLCSSHVRCVVPEGASTMINTPDEKDLADGLTGPGYHGSVMMRKSSYQQAGGYRAEFYYAQDLDLWSRMVEFGTHLVIPDVLYEVTLSPNSISGCHRQEQERFYELILAATEARRSGKDQAPWLQRAELLSQQCQSARRSKRKEAEGAYFIGSCLIQERPDLAKSYLTQCLSLNPLHTRALLKLGRLVLPRRR